MSAVRIGGVVLLLARLGLRAGDVAQLRLSDIDWRDGTLQVSGKGRYQARLPLPQDVGAMACPSIRSAWCKARDQEIGRVREVTEIFVEKPPRLFAPKDR